MRQDEGEIIATSPDGRHRVRLVQDTDANNPREEFDHIGHCAAEPDRTFYAPDKDNGPLSHAWEHYRDRRHRFGDAADLFDRYVRVYYGGATLEEYPHSGPRCVWYVTYEDMVTASAGDLSWITPERMAEVLMSERDEYRAWVDGDVYGIVIESRAQCEGHESVRGECMGLTVNCDGRCVAGVWEWQDSVWGFYGYEGTREEAERMFTQEYLPEQQPAAA